MTALDKLVEWSADYEQTADDAERELHEAGVDVESFLALVHERIAYDRPSSTEDDRSGSVDRG